MLVLSATGLILLRIGLPVIALVTIGLLIDRWQTRRMEVVNKHYTMGIISEEHDADAQEDVRLKQVV